MQRFILSSLVAGLTFLPAAPPVSPCTTPTTPCEQWVTLAGGPARLAEGDDDDEMVSGSVGLN